MEQVQEKDFSWEEAKLKLDAMDFPDNVGRRTLGEKHKEKGEEHETRAFIFDQLIDTFLCRFKYTICEECRKTIKQEAVMFNNQENKCYNKKYMKNAKHLY